MSNNANTLITDLARLLNIGEIDDSTLQLCIKLLDEGVDPQVLALSIQKIKSETRSIYNI